MRALLVLLGLAAIVVVVLMSFRMISIDGGSLPSVKLEAGTAPKVDVGSIDVGTVNKTVAVPVIDVKRADNTAEAAQ